MEKNTKIWYCKLYKIKVKTIFYNNKKEEIDMKEIDKQKEKINNIIIKIEDINKLKIIYQFILGINKKDN